jgi:hypothetical protein
MLLPLLLLLGAARALTQLSSEAWLEAVLNKLAGATTALPHTHTSKHTSCKL